MIDIFVEAPALAGVRGVRHGFFTRRGGVSEGTYTSLNCGLSSGDNLERVRTNRARALDALGLAPSSLVTGRQVHGIDVLVAEGPQQGAPPPADAVVTDRPGITLGVLSADCAPVLFVDPDAGVVGAAHAGWRGALAGVIEATVSAMTALGARPDRIVAAVGPCIAQASYEVGPDLAEPINAEDSAAATHFAPAAAGDRLMFDLEGYVLRRLRRARVGEAHGLGLDTMSDPERFFSSRRTRKAGGERFGLLLSAIALTG